MRQGRFSGEQVVAIIGEADRDSVAAVAKRHGINARRFDRPAVFTGCVPQT
jgi:hypothetical protein